MNKSKLIVFLHTDKHFEEFNLIRNKLKLNTLIRIVAINIPIRLFLKSKKIQFIIPEEFLTQEQAKEVDRVAFMISHNWHMDRFIFKNISLGQIAYFRTVFYFSRVIKTFQTILNIIEKEKPTEFLSFENTDLYIKEFNHILKYICHLKKITFNIIPLEVKSKGFNIQKSNQKKIMKNFLKTLISFRPVMIGIKYLLSLLYQLRSIKAYGYWSKKKKILIYTDYKEKALNIELSKDNQFQVYLLKFKPTFKDIINNIKSILGSPLSGLSIYLNYYKSKKLLKEENLLIKEYVNKWKRLFKEVSNSESFTYKNYNIWPIVKTFILSNIFLKFQVYIKNISRIHRLLKKERINFLIFHTDVTEVSKIFALVANQLNIPSMVIQHGITGHHIGFLPLSANIIAVWGKISKEFLEKQNLNSDRIIITGSSRYDKYICLKKNENLKKKKKNYVYSQFGIDKNKKLIVFTTNHGDFNIRLASSSLNQKEVMEMFDCVFKVFNDMKNSFLIIKLHPSDPNMHIPKKLINNLKIENAIVLKNFNTKNLITASDCIITKYSTTGLEAILLEKPIIVLNLSGSKEIIPYSKYNVAYRATNYRELIECINNAIKNPKPIGNYEYFLRDYLYLQDGLSTERIVKFIKSHLLK